MAKCIGESNVYESSRSPFTTPEALHTIWLLHKGHHERFWSGGDSECGLEVHARCSSPLSLRLPCLSCGPSSHRAGKSRLRPSPSHAVNPRAGSTQSLHPLLAGSTLHLKRSAPKQSQHLVELPFPR